MMDAVEPARLEAAPTEAERAAARTAETLDVVSSVIAVVHSTIDLRQVFARVAVLLRTLVDFDRATISLLEDGGATVRVFALVASNMTELKEGSSQMARGTVTDWLVRNRRALILQEGSPDAALFGGKLVFQDDLKSSLVIPLHLESGAVIGSLNLSSWQANRYSLRDVVLLKPLAEQMAIAIQKWRLYEELRIQNAELVAAYEQLRKAQELLVASEKLRALGVLAGGVAHDINNHLAAIVLNLNLVMGQIRSKGAIETLGLIRQTALDCSSTVRRIQEFAGVRAAKPFVAVDINQIVADAAAMTRPKWRDEVRQQGKFIELTTEPGEIAPIAGSPEDLRQVLVNLVMNAVDAISGEGRIGIRTWRDGNWVCVSVSDTGAGMSEAVKSRIFEPFFSTKDGAGHGFGLSTALSIVLRHDGEISVDSREAVGSTFLIRLPVSYQVPQNGESKVGRSSRRRVLVIEDEAAIRIALTQLLMREGHKVTATASGAEGVALHQREPYDVVLTDLGMAGMSGWEVAQVVKNASASTVVLLMSGWGEQIDETQLAEAGVDWVLAKPFQSEQVLHALERGPRAPRDEAPA